MPKKPLSDQVLVVTGASSGLGRAISRLAAVERFGRIDTYVANAIVTVYAEAERLEKTSCAV